MQRRVTPGSNPKYSVLYLKVSKQEHKVSNSLFVYISSVLNFRDEGNIRKYFIRRFFLKWSWLQKDQWNINILIRTLWFRQQLWKKKPKKDLHFQSFKENFRNILLDLFVWQHLLLQISHVRFRGSGPISVVRSNWYSNRRSLWNSVQVIQSSLFLIDVKLKCNFSGFKHFKTLKIVEKLLPGGYAIMDVVVLWINLWRGAMISGYSTKCTDTSQEKPGKK